MGSKILLLLSVLVVITKNHAAACSLNAIGVNFGSYDVFSPIALDGIGTCSGLHLKTLRPAFNAI
jgi:hypothetical protein